MKYLKDAFIQLPPTDLHSPCLATLKVIYLIHCKIIYHFLRSDKNKAAAVKATQFFAVIKGLCVWLVSPVLWFFKAVGENKYQEFSLCSHGNLGIDGNRFQNCF